MNKLSFNIALGGIVSALCILLMFLVGVLPFFVYVFPMLCSFMLGVVHYECGLKISLVAYASISILSLILSPDKESSIIFTAFFGYYPMAKIYLDRINLKLWRRLIKFSIFNFSVIASYYILIFLFGVVDMSEINGDFGEFGVALLLLIANLSFAAYDYAIKVLTDRYISSWRRLIFKRR